MKTLFDTIFLLVALSAIGWQSHASKPHQTTPKGWKSINANNHFSFCVPADMKPQQVQGIDSYVAQYHNKTIHLEYDYGLWSASLETIHAPELVSQMGEIAGKKARLVTYFDSTSTLKYIAAVHFPSVTEDGNTKLTMIARCKAASDYRIAKNIFMTITFP